MRACRRPGWTWANHRSEGTLQSWAEEVNHRPFLAGCSVKRHLAHVTTRHKHSATWTLPSCPGLLRQPCTELRGRCTARKARPFHLLPKFTDHGMKGKPCSAEPAFHPAEIILLSWHRASVILPNPLRAEDDWAQM